jgi:DNA-binding transcriptional regulator GbsR (MarR family)
MTETTGKKKLPAAVERFILHWGDMGDEWGVNRSVSQIHGLLYLSEAPMTAEDIADTLRPISGRSRRASLRVAKSARSTLPSMRCAPV